MLVTDRALAGGTDALVRVVSEAVQGGANAVQLREKDLAERELAALGRRLREATRERALLLVNGSLDVALECEADGVHLPEAAEAVETPLLVGRSVHSVEAARRAVAEGARYLVAGPVYETRSHPGRAGAGVELIRRISEAVDVPVVAIGGIDYQRVEGVVKAGACGVAVISALVGAAAPREAASQLMDALVAARASIRAT